MLPLLFHLLSRDTSGYWQQQVAYRITASLDEPTGVLTGHVRITYVNNSRDTLRDFFVHQYLNAFRPGSRWSSADSEEHRDRFQHLTDPDYAFERITGSRVMGEEGRPDYPYAPDSTIAHWTLARPLAPGDSLVADIDWQARLSTVPRRQGRQGRRFDFAQWYPKVVVYDKYGWEDHPLYPAGEFYGEFATFDVTLDLADDQVIGATGVPVEGDPGWKTDSGEAIDYQRDYYAPRPTTTCAAMPQDSRRKCVHFHAEHVHHFAFSLNPRYVYEQGRYGDVVVHVLYLPEDRETWGNGIALYRTQAALGWLDTLYGKYQWPQLTNVHRIEGGGTEFPMMVMNGGASLGLILHETGHQYTMGQLANNEWREGWLDEGFTSFQAGWFLETHGGAPVYGMLEPDVLWLDSNGWSEPVSMVSERFRDFVTYNEMIYAKAQLFYEELRYVVGDDVMRRILRVYFARWKLKHVDEDAFRSVCEEVSRQDLGWLFAQWLHATSRIDYRLQKVARRRLSDGRWRTTVTIERRAEGWMPLEIGDRDTTYARATGQPSVETVEFTSARKPRRLMLDPPVRTHDWNMLNNYEKRWGVGRGAWELRIDNPAHETVRRDRLVSAWLPVVWYNDFGGVSVGFRGRTNYLGSYDRDLFTGIAATRGGATDRFGAYLRVANPVSSAQPRARPSWALWDVEGRVGAALDVDRSLRKHLESRADPHVGFGALWMATTNLRYLDRRLWNDAGTVEAGPWAETTIERGATVFRARAVGHGGVAYLSPGPGITSAHRYDVTGFARLTGEASVRAPLWLGTRVGLRLFLGAYMSGSDSVKQRRIMVAGADPYRTFTNPLLRSAGAAFVRPDFHYHAPGDANLRAFRPDLGGRWAAALNAEVSHSLIRRERGGGLVRSVALEGFFDFALVDADATTPPPTGTWFSDLHDAGVGIVTRQQISDLEWTMRFEFPLEMNAWNLAPDYRPPGGRVAFRWLVGLSPSF